MKFANARLFRKKKHQNLKETEINGIYEQWTAEVNKANHTLIYYINFT